MMYTLINSTRLNGVDPLGWLADALNLIADIPPNRLHELLPWEWKRLREQPLVKKAA
jgi:transposase